MAGNELPIPELEDVLRQSPPKKRAEMLSRITDLFVSESHRYASRHIEIFDNVLCRLIDESETETLAVLSRRLAPLANAPIKAVGRLAHMDDLAIAEPVLMHSPRIEDAVLAYVAKAKSQAHRLAIACRSRIGPSITDMLVEQGDDVVVRYVANNPGAQFSDTGIRLLASKAETDGALAEQLHKRKDVSQRLKVITRRSANSQEKKNGSERKATDANRSNRKELST